MKINFRKIMKFKNILWIILILLIIIIGYQFFSYMRVYEGTIFYKTTTIPVIKTIVISPIDGTNTHLRMAEISLRNAQDNNISYTAVSSNGSHNSTYDVSKLYDGSTGTYFKSKERKCTLTLTIPDISGNNIVNKILLVGQSSEKNDLKSYKITLKDQSDSDILTKKFDSIDLIGLFTAPYMEQIIIVKDGEDGVNGVNGVNGEDGKNGKQGSKGSKGSKGTDANIISLNAGGIQSLDTAMPTQSLDTAMPTTMP